MTRIRQQKQPAAPDTTTGSDWRHNAACAGIDDPEVFYPVGSSPLALAQTEEAVATCNRCPVERECAIWALDRRIDHGVWGGLTEANRLTILKRRTTRLSPARKDPEPCGTADGYGRHMRRGTTPCERCKAAVNPETGAHLCGTDQGWKWHASIGEDPCPACLTALLPAVGPHQCGTKDGHQWHESRREDTCPDCLAAMAASRRRKRDKGIPRATAKATA